ncbi:hypothetical protein L1280_001524 [Deinococcus sp. HSC-46F16]|uniref:hypothetical protein n=1 Tax=Deinococcus sp. HSC-46F16 TaxID=2910968 RepID=UPI00209EB135|nr:hypothetical protein [Deinococcus sp. HSC-46F16]MCP2014387.1 hypothetical protein [Deinococcus sp. HSC-46F16]
MTLPSNVYLPNTLDTLLHYLDDCLDEQIDRVRRAYVQANFAAMGDDAQPAPASLKRELNRLLARKNEVALASFRLYQEYKLDDLEDLDEQVETPGSVGRVLPVRPLTNSDEEIPLF